MVRRLELTPSAWRIQPAETLALWLAGWIVMAEKRVWWIAAGPYLCRGVRELARRVTDPPAERDVPGVAQRTWRTAKHCAGFTMAS